MVSSCLRDDALLTFIRQMELLPDYQLMAHYQPIEGCHHS